MNLEQSVSNQLSKQELSRYARHLALPEVGITGQEKLKAGSVLCIGAGGLGSPLLLYLAAAGIGRIGIVDNDIVEESNLQRQVIHGNTWLKKPKAQSAKASIKEINPYCNVEIFESYLNANNAMDIIKNFDIICDCTDNFPSRYLINDACILLGKPNIYGSIAGFEGQSSVFTLYKGAPNYRDLIPEPPPAGLLPTCANGGVIGVLPGIIGLIQASEVIKIITGIGKPLSGRVLIFNALEMRFKEIKLSASSNTSPIKSLINYDEFCSESNSSEVNNSNEVETISVQDLNTIINKLPNEIVIIDVRESYEHQIKSLNGSVSIPLKTIENGKAQKELDGIRNKNKIFILCESGQRSLKAIRILKEFGIDAINVNGGMNAWIKEIEAK